MKNKNQKNYFLRTLTLIVLIFFEIYTGILKA